MHLLTAEFDHPEVTPCCGQDTKLQSLTLLVVKEFNLLWKFPWSAPVLQGARSRQWSVSLAQPLSASPHTLQQGSVKHWDAVCEIIWCGFQNLIHKKIKTHKRFIRIFLRTKHNMWITGVIPFTIMPSYKTTLKQLDTKTTQPKTGKCLALRLLFHHLTVV